MNALVRAAVLARAAGRCECGCGLSLERWGGEVDHFFGRAKAEETERTCWVLTPRCHFAKTRNHPSAIEWFKLFMAHCDRHGYAEERQAAQLKVLWKEAAQSFGYKKGR